MQEKTFWRERQQNYFQKVWRSISNVWIPHEGRFALVEEMKKKIMILNEKEWTYIKIVSRLEEKGGVLQSFDGTCPIEKWAGIYVGHNLILKIMFQLAPSPSWPKSPNLVSNWKVRCLVISIIEVKW
jgi:hypothetical protein